jgi:CheY-like chemotaxis protein
MQAIMLPSPATGNPFNYLSSAYYRPARRRPHTGNPLQLKNAVITTLGEVPASNGKTCMTETRSPSFWIVDDSKADRIIFKETLSRLGTQLRLREIDDGEILLNELDHKKNGELPDVIFLDISMRRMNGKSALQFIREDKRYDHIYIVMQTVSYRERSECIALGADAFISKSTNFNSYLKKLAAVISDWRAGA